MDYFVYAATSLSILAALTTLLVRCLEGAADRRSRRGKAARRRTVPTGFAIAGAGVIVLIGAALPS